MPYVPLRNILQADTLRNLGDVVADDLPVNPLYCILYTLSTQQAGASTTTDASIGVWDMLSLVDRLEILFRGTTIYSATLQDLALIAAAQHDCWPTVYQPQDSNAAIQAITIPIYLGRRRMNGAEAFPATRRGELTIRRQFASSATNRIDANNILETIETFELLGATPTSFLKCVTLTKTPPSTGDFDFDVPMGNPVIDILIHDANGSAAPGAQGIARAKLLIDNVEWTYAAALWNSLHNELINAIHPVPDIYEHIHTENLAAAYAADVQTGKAHENQSTLDAYAMLNFDPYHDDTALLQTAGRGRVHLRFTITNTGEIRLIPTEIIVTGQQAASGGA